MKVVIAIPAYNCAPQIGRVLDEIGDELAARVHEIWVLDNRSTDGTLAAAKAYRDSGRIPNLRVFRNRQNNSLGGTHKVAFAHAAAAGASHVVILHGDNQACSEEVARFIDHAENNPGSQTALGSRFGSGSVLQGYDRKRILGNRVLNAVYSALTLRRIEDLGSGLNLFALADLDPSTYLSFGNKMTFNTELLLDLVRRGVSFSYLPITWREQDQASNARNFTIFRVALVNLLRWRIGLGPRTPPGELDYEFDEH